MSTDFKQSAGSRYACLICGFSLLTFHTRLIGRACPIADKMVHLTCLERDKNYFYEIQKQSI